MTVRYLLARKSLPIVVVVSLGMLAAPAAIAADSSSVVSNAALASSCRQITTTSVFLGDDNGDGTTAVDIGPSATGPWTAACSTLTGPSPRQCLIPGLTPSTVYWLRFTTTDPDGVSGTSPEVLGTFATSACGSDQAAPTVLFQSPTRGAVIGGTERFKVQVWDQAGAIAVGSVTWGVDGGAPTAAVALNANYDCGNGCEIYEFDLDTTSLGNGGHFVTVQAVDGAGNTARVALAVTVNNLGSVPAGSGQLLRRTHGSQTCVDCHALASHSSQHTGAAYGNWAIDCLGCHTPHDTTNIYLVRRNLRTPASGEAVIEFRVDDRAGGTNPQWSYLGDTSGAGNSPYDDGICEACHTRTNHYRNDASGGDHSHNSGTRCVGCHPHSRGFEANESTGCVTDPVAYAECSSCHPEIWSRMTGQIASASVHSIGSVVGVNDDCQDSGVTWSEPLDTAVVEADRSCVNMCHQDHVHNQPGGTDHAWNVHRDATTGTSRAVTRDVGGNIVTGTPARTDFDGSATNGGMCVSCHRFAVDGSRGAVPKAEFDASAHDYTQNTVGASTFTWVYTLHDGSTFARNCTKCHAGTGDGNPNATNLPVAAVHYSDDPALLGGGINAGGGNASGQVCFICHGNGTIGVDRSGKDLATEISQTHSHPVTDDVVHDSAVEDAATYNDGSFSGGNRHVNCLDCHDSHRAGTVLHSLGTNLIPSGSALNGVSGVEFDTTGLGNFDPTGAGDFVWTPSATREYEICFKCHTSFAFGTNPPTGGSGEVETDVAQEFNPANRSGHPIVATLNAYTGNVAPKALTAAQLSNGWQTNPGTQTMYCSDCHGDESASPAVEGPHGSAIRFILKGPYTRWPTRSDGVKIQLQHYLNGLPAASERVFCLNCHPLTDGNEGWYNEVHDRHSDRGTNSECVDCHILVPHGGKMSRLIGDRDGTMPARYAYQGNLNNMQIRAYTKQSAFNYSKNNCTATCHGGGGAGSENW
jgi:nitrate/TMAO reductase-like tetraheme cytochrome c subunit